MLYSLFYQKSAMIPIPKGSNKETSDIRNYMLFDTSIISINSVVLRCDDLQIRLYAGLFYYAMVIDVIDYNINIAENLRRVQMRIIWN